MRRLVLAFALAAAGCEITYTIGGAGASATGGVVCPEGQEVCGDGCVAVGTCDDCPQGQVFCGAQCVEPSLCGDGTCLVGQVECDGECVAADTCPCAAGCDPEVEVCDEGVCRCREGLERCGSGCVDTRTDPANCSACQDACDPGLVCQDEACVASCDGPRVECGGACVDVESDSLHCGKCDKICPGDEVCVSGECREFEPIEGCASCPCPEDCEEGEMDMCCVDSPFLAAAICVAAGCG